MLRGEFINGNKEFIFKLKFYFLNTIVYKNVMSCKILNVVLDIPLYL